MDLTKLFEAQKKLDERIIEEKGLRGQDLIPQKVVALITELGECANEWRGFKFWSEDREPRTTLLEEYVDCLHFALSLNLEVWGGNSYPTNIVPIIEDTVEGQFIEVAGEAYAIHWNTDVPMHSGLLLANVLGLGHKLGFTEEQIEAAYFAKNATNHKRQEEHY